jgi:hypothetical protein
MQPAGTLVPFGILEVLQKQFNVIYGDSRETSDFIVDALELWWKKRKNIYPAITCLQIDLDNGPELESHRTQFIKRLVEFSDTTPVSIELVYYPPYHSKYNPVEHCWGVLESHWSGALLVDWETVYEWTRSMQWDGVTPNVYRLEGEYDRGIKLTKREMCCLEKRLVRKTDIARWSVKIKPHLRV